MGEGAPPPDSAGRKPEGRQDPSGSGGALRNSLGLLAPGSRPTPASGGVCCWARPQSQQAKEATALRGVLTCLRPVVWSCVLVGISPPTLQLVRSPLALPSALALPHRPSSPDLGLLCQAVGTGRGGTSRVLPVELPQGWAKT